MAIEVIPLKYGKIFKRVFGQLEVFQQFARDILGIELNISEVHTEYEYPEPVGFVRSQYDLFAEDVEQRVIVEIQHIKEEDFFDRFLYYHLISLIEQVRGFREYGFDHTVYTIVVLTSVPRDETVNFSYAVSDMNPVDEQGRTVAVYPHRLVFLVPRLVNEHTPPAVRKWLEFIADSLDGNMEERDDGLFQRMIEAMRRQTIDPDLLSEIKDEAAWELAKARFAREAREDGRIEGKEEGIKEGIQKGALTQQRKTVLQAAQMGMDTAAITALTGLTETEVLKILKRNPV